ncbi:ISL3 family transposase [Streptomyces sp. MZ04]|nr:ISL3 family transposase [Streptomyces sp. MZ04]TGB13762.1 ISL3 family transposase [Streptomyces sp. MZ04]
MVSCDELVGVLFPYLSSVLVERVSLAGETVHIRARTRDHSVSCPDCATASRRVHSTYERRLADGPVGGQPVLIRLTVRRLYCENAQCPRRTFVEQVDGLTVRYGRRTLVWCRGLEAVAVALAGARFAVVLHSLVSRTTLLRLLMALPDPAWTPPRVLGVDDFATRRGQHYGTVLINCETGQPLDLLPGRDVETLASWLREHPGPEIICRDRAGGYAYADGARTGAPQAVQVADPFHLWQNLATAVERWRRHNACLNPPDADENGIVHISFADEQDTTKEMSPIEAAIRERHRVVHALLDQGHGIREIARELHMGGNTVRRVARAEIPEQLLTGRHQPRRTQIDPYKPYVDKRWAEGCTNAVRLHTELKELGYQGTYRILSHYLRPRRRRRIRTVAPAPPGVRQVTTWMMRHPDRLRDDERLQLGEILARCPELTAADQLVRAFAQILTIRSGQHLKDWITAARAEDLPGLHTFAHGLEKDWDAVIQGLTTHWNSGPVEGRVNHIILWNQNCQACCGLPWRTSRIGKRVAFVGTSSCRGVGPAGVGVSASLSRRRSSALWPSVTAACSSSVSGIETAIFCKLPLASSSWALLESLGV